MTVFNSYSTPDKQIQPHNIKIEPQSRIITGDFNSHSPSWGYEQPNGKGEVKNWITENRFILIKKPDDSDTHCRTRRTKRTSDLAISTDDVQGIAEREVSSQLGGSDHRPVIISIKGQTQPHRNKLPASWNYDKKKKTKKKTNPKTNLKWDVFREAMDRKTAALELPEISINNNVTVFSKAVLEAAKTPIPRGRLRDYQTRLTPISLLSCVDILMDNMVNRSVYSHLERNSVISSSNGIQEVPKHRGPTCLPCPEHQRGIPGEEKGSGNFLQSFKCIWQVLERGTFCKTS